MWNDEKKILDTSAEWLMRTWVLLLMLTLLGTSLRLYHVSKHGMWLDEMVTLLASSGKWSHYSEDYREEVMDVQPFRDDIENAPSFRPMAVIRDVYQYEPSHPPLYYLVVNLSLAVLGTSEFAIRLPSVLFSSLAVPFLFLVGKRLYGAELGLVAAGIFSIAPYQIFYAQEARMYSMVCFLAVVSMWLFVELSFRREEGGAWSSWRLWAGWVGVTAAGLYTHYFFVFVPAVQFLFIAVRHFRDRVFLMRWFAALGLVLLVFLPWLVARIFHHSLGGVAWLGGDSDAGSLIAAAANGVMGFVWSDGQRPYKAVWFWITLLVIGTLALKRRTGLWLLPIWLIIPPALVVAIDLLLLTQASTVPRYYIVAAPALYLLLACGILTIRPYLLSNLVAGVGLVYLVLGVYWTDEGRLHPRDEFKEAAQRIVRETDKSDPVIMVSSVPRITAMMLAYYMDRPGMIIKIPETNLEKLNAIPQLDKDKPYDWVTLVVSQLKGVNYREFDPQTVTTKLPFLKFNESWKYQGLLVCRYRRSI